MECKPFSFWYFVPSWNFVESLVCLEPSSLLGVWYLLFSVYQWISHSSMYILWISSKWWFIHLVSFLHLFFFLCHLVSVLESLEHAYYLHVVSLACFLSLTQYIGETPPSLKLDEMCMKFIFIYVCTYLSGVCPMYCWFSNSLVPMSLVPFCLCCCSRNNWRCIGCSAHSQGRWCHHVLIGVKLGCSTNYYLLPSIGFFYILPMISR